MEENYLFCRANASKVRSHCISVSVNKEEEIYCHVLLLLVMCLGYT